MSVMGLALVKVVSTGVSYLCDNSTVSVKRRIYFSHRSISYNYSDGSYTKRFKGGRGAVLEFPLQYNNKKLCIP